MRELLGRLSAVDVGAENAVRVIAFFDALVDGHAGLDALLRGAAALAQSPVGLLSAGRHIHIRVGPDGHRLPEPPTSHPATLKPGTPQANWPRFVLPDGLAEVWIERAGPALDTDPMILERLAVAVVPVLERTRGRVAPADPALVEVVLDETADPRTREMAARRLGVSGATGLRAIAAIGPVPDLLRQVQIGSVTAVLADHGVPEGQGRWGVGPTVSAGELPRSWRGALLALRLTCDDTDSNPGPRQLLFDDLGPLALLASVVPPEEALIPDVRALLAVRSQWNWGLRTLVSLAHSASLRQAATELRVHHSTLQERVGPLAAVLGFAIDTADGRHRLYLALQLLRLHLSGRLP